MRLNEEIFGVCGRFEPFIQTLKSVNDCLTIEDRSDKADFVEDQTCVSGVADRSS
ncbi:MAG: hypothetical protein O9310_17135 [Leptospiraceae bacterium]|nr:hypothetical protein [Leptospiraceae bacterium]